MCKIAFGVAVGILQADVGPKIELNIWRDLCRKHGVRQESAARATPMQNGQVEQANQCIGEALKTMLLESNMESEFLIEAAAMYVFIHNLLPRHKLGGRSAWSVFTGK